MNYRNRCRTAIHIIDGYMGTDEVWQWKAALFSLVKENTCSCIR